MVYSASMVATKGTLTGGLEYLVRISTMTAIYVIMSFIVVFFIAFMLNIKNITKSENTEVDHDNHLRVTILTLIVGKNINGS